MSDDHPELADRPVQQLGGAARRPLDREPMEPEPAHAKLMPRRRDRIAAGDLGQCRVERRVEAGDVGNARERVACRPDRFDRGTVVERRQLGGLLDRGDRRVVELARGNEPLAAVDDAMGDGVDAAPWRRELRENLRQDEPSILARPVAAAGVDGALALDDVRLERARTGVERQDAGQEAGHVQSRISGGSSPFSRA